jgi:hypothetical protein
MVNFNLLSLLSQKQINWISRFGFTFAGSRAMRSGLECELHNQSWALLISVWDRCEAVSALHLVKSDGYRQWQTWEGRVSTSDAVGACGGSCNNWGSVMQCWRLGFNLNSVELELVTSKNKKSLEILASTVWVGSRCVANSIWKLEMTKCICSHTCESGVGARGTGSACCGACKADLRRYLSGFWASVSWGGFRQQDWCD